MPCGFTVAERRRLAGAGRSDPIDALAIARVTAREEDLVAARCTDDTTEELRILSDYRRQLVTKRIGLVHRVHAYLVVVLPGSKDKVPELTRPTQVGPPGATAQQVWGPDRADPAPAGPRSTGRPPSSSPVSARAPPPSPAP